MGLREGGRHGGPVENLRGWGPPWGGLTEGSVGLRGGCGGVGATGNPWGLAGGASHGGGSVGLGPPQSLPPPGTTSPAMPRAAAILPPAAIFPSGASNASLPLPARRPSWRREFGCGPFPARPGPGCRSSSCPAGWGGTDPLPWPLSCGPSPAPGAVRDRDRAGGREGGRGLWGAGMGEGGLRGAAVGLRWETGALMGLRGVCLGQGGLLWD